MPQNKAWGDDHGKLQKCPDFKSSLYVLPACYVWVLQLPPTVQNLTAWLIGLSKLPLGWVCVCAWLCFPVLPCDKLTTLTQWPLRLGSAPHNPAGTTDGLNDDPFQMFVMLSTLTRFSSLLVQKQAHTISYGTFCMRIFFTYSSIVLRYSHLAIIWLYGMEMVSKKKLKYAGTFKQASSDT